MDGSRFDSLARTLASSTTRRNVVRTLLGAVAAGFAASAKQASAQDTDQVAARKGPYWRAGKRCATDDRCGAKVPCTNGRCTPDHCYINEEEVPATAANPANTCEWCFPALMWNGWGGVTGDGEACTVADPEPCHSNTGQCLNNDCVTDPLPDGDLCGIGQVCCGGVCCTSTQCCGESGICEECGPHCTIDGVPYPEGAPHPDGACLSCNPATEPFFWSTAPDDMSCGPNRIQVCCSGSCCGTGQCCDAERSCAIDECGPTCTIDGTTYAGGALNDDVPCQVCDPSRSTTAWSAATTDFPCGASGTQVCCDGICCDSGECCGMDACSVDCRTCLIDGVVYPDGAHNPRNLCEYCRAGMGPQTTTWTVNANNDLCGPNNDRVCCEGVCLRPGLCCSSDGSRVGGDCAPDCTIDGVDYDEGDHPTPDNTCAVCNPADPEHWTLQPDNAACGDTQSQVCCAGVCCPDGQCCGSAGQCEPCAPGCTIDGVFYADGTRNPAEFCEACNAAYPTEWSPRANPDCPPPCTIDGLLIAYGTVNPANPCEHCDGNTNDTSWSPSGAVVCGEAQDQACCNGACCNSGECCTADGVCGSDACDPEGCTIDGAQYADGAVNPGNECQICSVAVSATTWSSGGFGGCGGDPYRFCAGGVCCDLGICPDLATDTCGDYCSDICVIGGVHWFNGDRNPANPCELCGSHVDHTSWSLVARNNYCDPDAQTGACCDGTCCDPGHGCSHEGVCIPLGS